MLVAAMTTTSANKQNSIKRVSVKESNPPAGSDDVNIGAMAAAAARKKTKVGHSDVETELRAVSTSADTRENTTVKKSDEHWLLLPCKNEVISHERKCTRDNQMVVVPQWELWQWQLPWHKRKM